MTDNTTKERHVEKQTNFESAFLFMADAHITRRTWVNSTVLSYDAYTALLKVADKINGMGIRTLVIGGDWFDTNRPSSDDLVATMQFIRRFDRVFYIRGNHDSVVPSYLEADADNAMDHCAAKEIGTQECTAIEFPGCLLYGIPYMDDAGDLRKELDAAADNARFYNKPLVIVMHATFRHLLGFDGTWQLDGDELPELFKDCPPVTILVGHIHVRDTRKFGNVTVHSPGSLYPRSSDKMMDEHAVTLVFGATGQLKSLGTDVRRYFEAEWTNQQDLDDMAKSMVKDNPKGWLPPYLLLKLPPKSEDHPKFPDGIKMQVTFRKDINEATVVQRKRAVTLEDAVAAECDDEDMRQLALALMRTDDVVAEVDKWLSVWGVEKLE